MNCNNKKCKREIRNYYTCKKCGLSFCTNSCMTQHIFEEHSAPSINKGSLLKSHNQNQNQIQSNQSMKNKNYQNLNFLLKKSPFIKEGEFLREINDDQYFDYKNFEYINDRKKSLGSGAFGDVFLAKNKIDGKLFAIKIMEKNKIEESGASLDIIYREISIHRRINHENIVKLFGHFEEKQFFYLIMEYINGGSLFSFIKKTKGVDEKKAFKYFIQACAAVNFLHENNLIHRDLKPENLLIDNEGNLKLCDFGWCVDVTTGNRVTFCGTYEYMAPEIVKEEAYNLGIDVWSLGILLYELTHGYSPFRAQEDNYDDYNEIFKNIIKYKFKIEKDISKNCIDLITSKKK